MAFKSKNGHKGEKKKEEATTVSNGGGKGVGNGKMLKMR